MSFSKLMKSPIFAFISGIFALMSFIFTMLPHVYVDTSFNDFSMTPPLTTDPNHAVYVFFTNVGPNTVEGVKVAILTTDVRGEKSYAEADIGIVGSQSRRGAETLRVTGEPVNSLVCVSYESGPFRRGWVLVSGKPSLSNFERRILLAIGSSYFSKNPCKTEIMRADAAASGRLGLKM